MLRYIHMQRAFAFILFLSFSISLHASHVMGGEITWSCSGSNTYEFQLVFYRDCNGAEVNIISEDIRVWNHPTLNSIVLNFISREDISPSCTVVAGSPPMLECGTGSAAGNGVGAIERITYRSNPISIEGIPPSEGWIFTYENFSRSNAISNLSDPSTFGITLAAKMFANPNSTDNTCTDSSPNFLQSPHFVTCAGSEYRYNMNAIDPDLDSLHFQFGIPFDYFPVGVYDPPTNPMPVPFETGYSYDSPTPDTDIDANNIPASIDPSTGEIVFTSFNIGNFNIKVTVQSFRNGILIGEVEREMQVVVLPCSSDNDAPVITPPFAGGLFETTVNAGDLIDFDLLATDLDLLQNGSAQNVIISASGPMFGAGYTSPLGCDIEPCATLNSLPPIEAPENATASFSWQTTCDHLVNQFGGISEMIPYDFVFKVQDNFCQVPKITYATVRINVVNPGVLQAPKIDCIQTDAAGNLTLNWTSINDPFGSFIEYGVYSIQDGLLANLLDVNANSFPITGSTDAQDFFLSVKSGCNGNTIKYSDTVSNIFLNLNNPGNGMALLTWNAPSSTPLSYTGDFYHIYREYPTGIFTLIDSVALGTNSYQDTIDICAAFLNYQIVLPGAVCDFTSDITGDVFEDLMTPDIPIIYSAGIDTATNLIQIEWSQNLQSDTYGYVIYTFDASGILFELDTVWGISTTTYTYAVTLDEGPFSYSVAAFDSCETSSVPVTYQTSAKADVHTTMVSSSEVFMCEQEAILSWTNYEGSTTDFYEIWSLSNGLWNLEEITEETTATIAVNGNQSYTIYINSIFIDGNNAFSAPTSFNVPVAGDPGYNYLKLVSVVDGNIELYQYIDESVGINEIIFQRRNYNGAYEEIGRSDATSDVVFFLDEDAETEFQAWQYRTKYIDSCGFEGEFSNEAKTIFLEGEANDYDYINTLNWSDYEGFDGGIKEYKLYRSINGSYDPTPIATFLPDENNFIDDINGLGVQSKVCYRIAGEEVFNSYSFSETSSSNELCLTYSSKIFIPNAFTPGGINPIFLPVVSHIKPETYHLTIINRWGQLVFESFDQNIGWDGTIQTNGSKAKNDVYVYIFEAEDDEGNFIQKKGFVSLIK